MKTVSIVTLFIIISVGCASMRRPPDFFWIVTNDCGTRRIFSNELDLMAREEIKMRYQSSDVMENLRLVNAKSTQINDNNHFQLYYRSELHNFKEVVTFNIFGQPIQTDSKALSHDKEFTIFTKQCIKKKISLRELDNRARQLKTEDNLEFLTDQYKLYRAGYHLIDNNHYIRLNYSTSYFSMFKQSVFFDIHGNVFLYGLIN